MNNLFPVAMRDAKPATPAHALLRERWMEAIGRSLIAVVLVATSTGELRAEEKPEPPYHSAVREPALEKELTEQQVLSTIAGIAVESYEKEHRDWSIEEMGALASGYWMLRDDDAALELLGKVVALMPDDPDRALAYAIQLRHVGRPDDAIEFARKGLNSRERMTALIELVSCYLKTSRFEEAYLLTPEILRCRYYDQREGLRALLHYSVSEPNKDRAREILQKALEGVPDDYLVYDLPLAASTCGALIKFDMQERKDAIFGAGDRLDKVMPALVERATRSLRPRYSSRSSGRAADNAESGEVGLTQTVRAIEVQFLNPYTTITSNAVLAAMKTKVGKLASDKFIEADVRALYATGLISNVRMFGEAMDGGWKVIVLIEQGVTR
jgi:tetratricopeptide (TPR) repeat protein